MKHGTNTSYAYGCRCDLCRDAHRIYSKDWRHRNPTIARKCWVDYKDRKRNDSRESAERVERMMRLAAK